MLSRAAARVSRGRAAAAAAAGRRRMHVAPASLRAENVGVAAMHLYVPPTYVSQDALEEFDGVAAGKYTKGLGQTNMAFCGASEDIVSMMLTATQGLLDKSGVRPEEVGRLEVGTETLVDKSKATKTSLMQLFGDDTDIEGVDTINACYGGTNALFNCLHWMSSAAWDGRYAIVVTGDIAVYERGPARPTGGAGVVAMLIGPDAPIEVDIAAPRATHMEDAYDFYKPDLKSEYPAVDGHLSNTCYLRALDRCFGRMALKTEQRRGHAFDFRDYENAIFHQPYQKLVKKSYARYLWNQHRLGGDVDASLDQFLGLGEADTYANRDLEKALMALVNGDYEKKVYPSTWLGRESGNMYTGSLYAGLASLVGQKGASLAGERGLLFSYGSGLAATMFQVNFRGDARGAKVAPAYAEERDLVGSMIDQEESATGLASIQRQLALDDMLASRVEVSPSDYTDILEERRETYGHFPLSLGAPDKKHMRPGSFYLKSVDELGRRTYIRSFSSTRAPAHGMGYGGSAVTGTDLPQLARKPTFGKPAGLAGVGTSFKCEDSDGWSSGDAAPPPYVANVLGSQSLSSLCTSILPSQLNQSTRFRHAQSAADNGAFNTPIFPVP